MNSFPRFLIFVSLILVIWAYSPTIGSNYVTQDQWRAFRYSVPPETPSFRTQGCINTVRQSYIMTGRPLVWLGECLEHAAVSRIEDFIYSRPFILIIVLLTVIYVGSAIGYLVGGPVMGVTALSLFVFAPGYSFMYLQGMPAVTVLVGIILAVISFLQFNQWLDRSREINRVFLIKLVKPMLLFVLSCMIYPSGAFVVVTMALLRFGFDENTGISERFSNLAKTLGFYFLAAITYYFCIKIMILLETGSMFSQNIGGREFIIQLDFHTLWERIKELIVRLYNTPLLNFPTPAGAAFVVLGFFSLKVGFEIMGRNHKMSWNFIMFSAGIFSLSALVLVVSLSPWLFSHMNMFAARYFIPVYFFFCATIVGLIWSAAKHFSITKRFIPIVLIVFLLMPIAILQRKYSLLEVAVFKSEIGMLRSALGEWLDKKGYINNKYLLVVLPQEKRPAFVGMKENAGLGENAVLASAENPLSIPWMITALLRERQDHPIGKTLGVSYCSFDQNCAADSLAKGYYIVYGVTNGDSPIKTKQQPFIINFSLLTSKKVYPVIEIE